MKSHPSTMLVDMVAMVATTIPEMVTKVDMVKTEEEGTTIVEEEVAVVAVVMEEGEITTITVTTTMEITTITHNNTKINTILKVHTGDMVDNRTTWDMESILARQQQQEEEGGMALLQWIHTACSPPTNHLVSQVRMTRIHHLLHIN